jgi:hypothetical protein
MKWKKLEVRLFLLFASISIINNNLFIKIKIFVLKHICLLLHNYLYNCICTFKITCFDKIHKYYRSPLKMPLYGLKSLTQSSHETHTRLDATYAIKQLRL